MRTLVTGIWKEWRDARGIACALLVALPVLAFAAAFAFGDEVPVPSFGGLSLFVITVAQALYVLAVASESFGGERRRGTLDFLRRLPSGIGRAFAAKGATYVLGSVVACAWGALVAWTVCATLGPDRAAGDFATLLLTPDPLTTTLALALFVLGLWTLFVSNFVPQGGAATVGAGLLLGLLGVPVYLALKDRPWLLKLPSTESLRLGLALLGAVGTCALLVAFLRGCRFLGGVWAPAWRGLSVVLVLACGGYAWGAVERERALTLDPSQPDFQFMDGAYVGVGGRYLFANVFRGDNPWHPGHPDRFNGTPIQPWIIDLKDGSWRVAGEFRQGWAPLSWDGTDVPQPVLRRHDDVRKEIGWFDGATGTLRKVLPDDVRTPDIQAWVRASMPALAWHKDHEGRALWLEGGQVVREGDDTPIERWFPGLAEPHVYPVADGWIDQRFFRDDPQKPTWGRVAIESATGAERRLTASATPIQGELFLSTRTVLRRTQAKPEPGKRARLLPWTLVDLVSGGEQAAVNPPKEEWLFAALPGERALVLTGEDRDRQVLSAWDPRTGATTPILDEQGQPVVGQYADVPGSAPGLRVVRMQVRRPDRRSAAYALFLLDDALGHAWRLPSDESFAYVIAIEGPGSVLVRRGRCQVIRYTLQQGPNRAHAEFTSEVLFPR